MEKEKKVFSLRVDREIHERLQTLSKVEERTIASIVRQALKEFLKRRGGWED